MCGFRGFQKDQGERELYKMGVVVQRLSEKKKEPNCMHVG